MCTRVFVYPAYACVFVYACVYVYVRMYMCVVHFMLHTSIGNVISCTTHIH